MPGWSSPPTWAGPRARPTGVLAASGRRAALRAARRPVAFATDTVGASATETVEGLGDGDVALLENVRFNDGETSKDDAVRASFADQLAQLADAFVSDGFGVVHRKQASVYDVALRLPSAMGGLVAAEVDVLRRLTEPGPALRWSCWAGRRSPTSSASSTT